MTKNFASWNNLALWREYKNKNKCCLYKKRLIKEFKIWCRIRWITLKNNSKAMGFDFWLKAYKSNQLVSFDDHEVIWKINRYFSDMFRSVNRWFEITYAFTQTKKIFSLDKKAAHIDHTRNFPPDSAISCLALCKLYNCHVDHHGGQTYFGIVFLPEGK